MPVPFEGGCRCGAVRYRCSAEPLVSLHCYCRDCQYASGGACSTVVVLPADAVAVSGEAKAFAVQAESGTTVERQFCPTCGTPLFARNPNMPVVRVIRLATLGDPSWVTPVAHIWTKSAPPWACIAEGLPRFAKNFGEE